MVIHKKRLGQHFLHDKNIINKIIKFVKPNKLDNFIEIGPGEGAITIPLIEKISKLILIEKDRSLIPILKDNLSDFQNITFINEDILKYEFKDITKDEIRIIGNLPYNISTEILFKIASTPLAIIDAHFMLQKEVIDRIIAKPGSKEYGRLSIMCQVYFDVKKLFEISPNAFYPKPKVQSAYIRMKRLKSKFKNNKHEKYFYEIVRKSFIARRKMIKTSLKDMITENDWVKLGINNNKRPEQLSVENFLNISSML
ncbi:MAG: 16S rRNA (adenine(1518)-N(6)/adenine(1519)-N(6))-dimethyltransferase RsmA [Pelagibacterales bacterium]|nr:16S rRNA (adenine(1518)-N(6)/adenine(1519)-N(6))-dimethyltransferase RsmA [Pelagibacterales bacterium]|tara:strand:- start:702 stop:1466 length:765 start_codon:yes stop_codon:yes gene_type:complete